MLRLLGTPEVSHAEQPLTFQTRKVLALLAYLAVEQGVHSRDKIAALLWPESDEERGKASLRRALAYLRENLDEPSHERSRNVPLPSPHVLVEHHTLSFNLASDFEMDTQTLQTAFTLAHRRSSGDLRTHLARLQMAASCYRGNFLDGLSLPDTPDFEDWLLLQRESWRRQANTVFDRLSQWQAEGGELENALDTTTRWVEHDLLRRCGERRNEGGKLQCMTIMHDPASLSFLNFARPQKRSLYPNKQKVSNFYFDSLDDPARRLPCPHGTGVKTLVFVPITGSAPHSARRASWLRPFRRPRPWITMKWAK